MNISVRFTGFAAVVVAAGFAVGLAHWAAVAQAQPARPTAPSAVTAAGVTLHSVSVELPNSDRTFPGDGDAEAINDNCLACHSAGMVLNQPNLTRTAWQQEVEKMRAQYKAPVDEKDVPTIVAYLMNHKGVK